MYARKDRNILQILTHCTLDGLVSLGSQQVPNSIVCPICPAHYASILVIAPPLPHLLVSFFLYPIGSTIYSGSNILFYCAKGAFLKGNLIWFSSLKTFHFKSMIENINTNSFYCCIGVMWLQQKLLLLKKVNKVR